jgi:hypothetical protein
MTNRSLRNVPQQGRLTKLLFWAMTRDPAHRVCARVSQGLLSDNLRVPENDEVVGVYHANIV